MRYYRAQERDYMHSAAFRLYMAQAAKLTVQAVGGVQMIDYADLIADKPVDNRTGDEIAEDIIRRAGLRLGGDTP